MLISNEAPIFRRATDATGVKAVYHVIAANHEQWGEYGNFSITAKLPINESRRKEHDFHIAYKNGFNPHPLILEISCDEGKKLKHETQFDINS